MNLTNIFDGYAALIWQNDTSVKDDFIRHHTSGYHIVGSNFTIAYLVENAHEILDIDPRDCGIDVSIDKWQQEIMDDSRMLAAMTRKVYQELKIYGHFTFDGTSDFEDAAATYVREEL